MIHTARLRTSGNLKTGDQSDNYFKWQDTQLTARLIGCIFMHCPKIFDPPTHHSRSRRVFGIASLGECGTVGRTNLQFRKVICLHVTKNAFPTPSAMPEYFIYSPKNPLIRGAVKGKAENKVYISTVNL